jgi:hypothetical protein
MKKLIKIEHSLDVKERTQEEIDSNIKFLLWFVLIICFLGIAFAVFMTLQYY